ncbi:hypothetical protein F4556_001116 [Kitasatospora gansuensis]|uniref:Uncharacterized protein n=1 Tax=Kitasatospora gansuensis TaxID=258050 RepID=A0A7W7SA09_9ACTN|nr:hypothetical protein [Kitasatospora gansuensis]MBB4945581.1 hypothetical protein [Kitasatospora gansuensis]
MADRARDHADQLNEALAVLGIDWHPDQVASDEVRAVMLATALLGAAEAHLVGAEMAAGQAGGDLDALRQAYGPVREEVVAAAAPDVPDHQRLVLMLRTGMLVGDLARAAGPDQEHPDIETLAAARDAAACASALIGYHFAPTFERQEGLPERGEFLGVAAGLVRSIADRLVRIARSGRAPG